MIKKTLLVVLSLFSFTIVSANTVTVAQTEKSANTVKTNTVKTKKMAPKQKRSNRIKRDIVTVEEEDITIIRPVKQNQPVLKDQTRVREQTEMKNAAQGRIKSAPVKKNQNDNPIIIERTIMKEEWER